MTRSQEYRKYLTSAQWHKHRDFALTRTSGFCQFCGNVAVHVHHVRYPKQFGKEHPHSLIPVCERCHDTSVLKMKALTNVVHLADFSPNGAQLKYLLSGGRVYASAKSWGRALQVPATLSVWFESGLPRTAMLKRDLAGGELEMSYQGVLVYRWHAVAESMRAFDRQWYQHEFKSREKQEQREIEQFHDNYERLVSWGYDLQERALNSALQSRTNPTAPINQETLLEALKQAVAPRLQVHDEKLNEHDVVIAEIKDAVPMLRDQEEFIPVRQAISEQGLDPTMMPLHPQSRENLSGLIGQMLKSRGVEQGGSVMSRIDGRSLSIEMNTYRRRDIYSVLAEITRTRQSTLPLC